MRPLMPKDLEVVYEHFARNACEIVNDQKEAYPQLAFVQMDDAKPGVIADLYMVDPSLVLRLFNAGHRGKLAMRVTIASTLGDEDASPFPLRDVLHSAGMRADMAVQVSEAWTAAEVPNDDPLRQVQPSQRTDRGEALLVMVHVKGHTTGEMMPITTVDGRRHVDYVPLSDRGGIMGGDMAMQGWDDTPEEHKP